MTQMRREQSLLFFPIKFVPFLSRGSAVCSEQAEAESTESLENAPKITCLENSTSKQVIVSCLSGLSWELLWHRVHVLSQNPQLDCNQRPLAACAFLISFPVSVSPLDAKFFKAQRRRRGSPSSTLANTDRDGRGKNLNLDFIKVGSIKMKASAC